MNLINIEIKTKCENPEAIKLILRENGAEYHGRDHQIDTYFKTKTGRLKFRNGNIENRLVYYERENIEGPKQSDVILLEKPDSELIGILIKSLGILAVVEKTREIYLINNVRFHVDEVNGLGNFVEIEAIDYNGDLGKNKLLEQCNYYLQLLKINGKGLIRNSYGDMLLEKGGN
ncbi:class IV adenylate cyclase [Candidatus Pacearchaeota archaeon]|nr:class IV adenylate cyclase [Candidatus Pacearchaeota archaeon]